MAKGDVCEVEGCGSTHKVCGKTGKFKINLCLRHRTQMSRHGKIFTRTVCDPNEIVIKGNVLEVTLYNKECLEVGKTLVSYTHLNLMRNHKWCLSNNGYVTTMIDGNTTLLHRLITGVSSEYVVDHKDHQKLNNTDENLRVCSIQENQRNSMIAKNNTSGCTGVYWNSKLNKWVAQIKIDGKVRHVGQSSDINVAIDIRKKAEIKHFGKFSYDASVCLEMSDNVTEVI